MLDLQVETEVSVKSLEATDLLSLEQEREEVTEKANACRGSQPTCMPKDAALHISTPATQGC